MPGPTFKRVASREKSGEIGEPEGLPRKVLGTEYSFTGSTHVRAPLKIYVNKEPNY
jgi:hypothetical protein